jgi:hypothetical protein
VDDDNLYKYEDFGFIGFDLWQAGLAKKHHQSQMWVPDFRGAISIFVGFFVPLWILPLFDQSVSRPEGFFPLQWLLGRVVAR